MARIGPLLGALLVGGVLAAPLAAAPKNDPHAIEALKHQAPKPNCGDEAVRIRRAEAELPRLDVAPPDHQIVCITIETNLLFVRRLAAHVKACPRSPYAEKAESWNRTEETYSAQFRARGCRQAIKAYRG